MSAILPGLTRTLGPAALALGLAPVLATMVGVATAVIAATPGYPSSLGRANAIHKSRGLRGSVDIIFPARLAPASVGGPKIGGP